MFKNIVPVLLIAVFSCNNTHQETTWIATDNCLGIKALDKEVEAKVRASIKGDLKAARLDSVFQQKVKMGGFNGNVLIAQNGVVLYRRSFGYGQIENKDTLRPESKFQLASLSKTFTAVAVLKLYEQGKLSLEDTIQKFIPQFPYSGIQIKSLLSHRSGLPNYAYVLTDSVRKRNRFPSNDDIVRWYCYVKPKLYNSPNRHFSYSNTNYALLATIIERVSGQPFEVFLRKNIFAPLGMHNTWLTTTRNDSINIFRTVGYQYNRKLPKDNYDDVIGDKGVYSTSDDILRWYMGLNSGCLLNPATLKEAFTPRSLERRGIKNYGYGFRMQIDEATQQPKYVYHTGWWKGYNTLMWFSPKDQFVVIILSNRYNRNVYQIKSILEVLHGKSSPITDEVDEEM
ncbi:MAG: class A beta-lactamase-related serine hydrolase [Cytophagia bacterium]|nr:MAG: class A beta-lactamase-related serine hydrolase [Cytophagales bacterium]TAG35117.1 MAG: class A beta-lactamase-related serine hydrolase [Cytophagia bacterium]TAG77029.1 MAG: class A beta-lactamase-related serine hydrolase [Cytophagales bacterium]